MRLNQTVALVKQESTIYHEWKVINEGHLDSNECFSNFLENEGKENSLLYVACNQNNPDWIAAMRRSDEIQDFHGNAVC